VAGVLGVVPGVMGLLQATEAIKVLLGIGDPLVGRLLIYDALDGAFSELQLRRDPHCPACGDGQPVETAGAGVFLFPVTPVTTSGATTGAGA
jgi:molybdopterin/thiamine biosynthesis adenylyltransferase